MSKARSTKRRSRGGFSAAAGWRFASTCSTMGYTWQRRYRLLSLIPATAQTRSPWQCPTNRCSS